MNPDPSLPVIVATVGTSLPILLLHFVAALVLLGIGLGIYMLVTPFHERELMREGNASAGVVLAGATLALALPLAALLGTSGTLVDIVVWGIVAVVIQLLTVWLVSLLLLRDLRAQIESNTLAAAVVLAAMQIAVGLLNAAVMVPN